MLLANAPAKLVLPFAENGDKNTIPTASQIGVVDGAASLVDGFPPLTMTPLAAGGVPPAGQDMNGILYQLSAISRWLNAGGGFPFDAGFVADANVAGYPKGARVLRADGAGYWLNTTDSNTTDPESAEAYAAGWRADVTPGVTAVTVTTADVTLTPAQYGRRIIAVTGALTGNRAVILPAAGEWVVANNTTGAYTLTAKTAAGAGVEVQQGESAYLVGDGTNVVDATSRAALLAAFASVAAGKGDSLLGVKHSATGAVARTQHDKNEETVSVWDFFLAVEANHTGMFTRACATGRKVIAANAAYTLVGEVPLASGTVLEFTNHPAITWDLSGENGRGFWFGAGVSDAAVVGSADISASATSLGSDGSRNGVFSFNTDFYLTADPEPIRRCRVVGNFNVEITGANNCKVVQGHGNLDGILVHGVHATGQSNFAFVFHWAGNGTAVTLPTKTWHPDNIVLRDCTATHNIAIGSLLRAFTASACGRVLMENCKVNDATVLGFNLFVGDYGYQYAQNITDDESFQIALNDCASRGPAPALSVDGLSSMLNGSSYWVGADRNAKVSLDNFDAYMDAGINALPIAVTGIRKFYAKAISVVQKGANARECMQIVSCADVDIQGDAFASTQALFKDCGNVHYNVNTRFIAPNWDASSSCVAASALSFTATTVGAISAGDTSLVISAATSVVGQGGFVRYNDGSRDYEIEMTSTTYAGDQQTVTIREAPVAIPDAATVTIIQTIRSITVGPVVLDGARSLVRFTGTSTARVRNAKFKGTKFSRSGVADIDASTCDGLDIDGTFHDHGGNTTLSTARFGILLGTNTQNYRIRGSHFGKNNQGLRDIISLGASDRGTIDGNIFESHSPTTGGAEAIDLGTATNVTVGAGNIYAAGVTP